MHGVESLQPAQVGENLGGVLVPQVTIFLETLAHDALQAGRDIAGQSGDLPIEHRIEERASALPTKGAGAGRHLIQNNAEGEQIGSGVEGLRANLLGRHVCSGAWGATRLRQVAFRGYRSFTLPLTVRVRAHLS